jgi:hypothetical protein
MDKVPQNWDAIKDLFGAALQESPARRSSFLRERCNDASVCAEVERLLAEHEQAGSFLSNPPLDGLPVEGTTETLTGGAQTISLTSPHNAENAFAKKGQKKLPRSPW